MSVEALQSATKKVRRKYRWWYIPTGGFHPNPQA
jgi:hypothetical protein